MTDWLKRALTRKVKVRRRGRKPQVIEIQPNKKLVLGIKFAIAMVLCLSGLEISHMAFLGSWNSQIFSAISGLIGTISGVLIGHRA